MPNKSELDMLRKQNLEGEVREKLRAMELSPLFYTASASYTANTKLYPSGEISFVDKHIAYLVGHPKVDPQQYLSNLHLMLKKN